MATKYHKLITLGDAYIELEYDNVTQSITAFRVENPTDRPIVIGVKGKLTTSYTEKTIPPHTSGHRTVNPISLTMLSEYAFYVREA